MKPNLLTGFLATCGIAFILLIGSSVTANGQQTPPVAPPTRPAAVVNENFELNIGERRITEQYYERSTSVTTGEPEDEKGMSVNVGAIVQAERVEILLRGITGTVRFRASLESLRQRIERTLQTTRPLQPVPR